MTTAQPKAIPVCPHCGRHIIYVPLADHIAVCPVVLWHLPNSQSNELFARLVQAGRARAKNA